MVTKAKETVEVETTETETSTDEKVSRSEIADVVRDVLKDLLPGKTETTETSEPEKRLSVRDEEERTRGIVATAIEEFKKGFKGDGETKEPTKEPEKVPGSSTVRKVEHVLWGAE